MVIMAPVFSCCTLWRSRYNLIIIPKVIKYTLGKDFQGFIWGYSCELKVLPLFIICRNCVITRDIETHCKYVPLYLTSSISNLFVNVYLRGYEDILIKYSSNSICTALHLTMLFFGYVIHFIQQNDVSFVFAGERCTWATVTGKESAICTLQIRPHGLRKMQ